MYRLRPTLKLKHQLDILEGTDAVGEEIKRKIKQNNHRFTALEAFPGVETDELEEWFIARFPEALIINSDSLYYDPVKITGGIHKDLTNDVLFGKFSSADFVDFLNPSVIIKMYQEMADYNHIILMGVGASQIIRPDFTIYADISRWEVQLKFRKGMMNWKGLHEEDFNAKLKRAYYFEWPAADAIKDSILSECDYYIDYNQADTAKMIPGSQLIEIAYEFTKQPFRLMPYFDSGVWGGDWMQNKFNVDKNKVNLAWCFDGVPEENSVLVNDGRSEIEMPAYNIITLFPMELLGAKVFGRYGRDYPIRFNYLDTMNGQNLSLQVHPTYDYARRHFRAKYTQDESYYVMACEEGAVIYLGLKRGISKDNIVAAFEAAQETGTFDEEKYINQIPVKKHDHILIPGGTIHSSGKNAVVLEISSTPNRFTFKLWDWGRVDLDGKPRPISLHHGRYVINDKVDTDYVYEQLYNKTYLIHEEAGFVDEHTGLHDLEAIESRRLTFSKAVTQSTMSSPNTLNLVEGKHIQVQSLDKSFDAFDVYYGETFIIPEQIKEYKLVPLKGQATVIKAYIR